jgi:dipeptidyl aminopeptidase/acylaminoacyl peptidase
MRFLFVIFAFFSVPIIGFAQDTLWTPQHVAKLRIVTEAVISPDGTHVAYVLAVPRNIPKEKDGPAWTELHVVDIKGNSTPYIIGQVNVGSITWTPDGKQIAFLAKRDKDEHKSLYVIGAKGGEARKLLAHATDIQGYSFSGDGKKVAFLATRPMSKEKKAKLDQGFTQEIYEEDQPFVHVYVAPIDGGVPDLLALKGSASELHFNPKEDKIAVALAPSPGIDDHIMFRKVHIVDLKTGKATNLNNPGKLGQLAWSPDGKKLAMISAKDEHDPREGRVYVADPQIKLTGHSLDHAPMHAESVAWRSQKDVTILVSKGVASANHGATIVRTPEGKGIHTKVLWGEVLDNGLIASNISVASDGKTAAILGQTAFNPPEVYLYDLDTSPARRLSDSNPWLKNMKFAKQEIVKYKARDGLELEGILIRPLYEEKDKRYPLVLNVHGGPEAHYSNGWITNYNALGQVAAAKGMAVFYPNYRGSTGYGVEFSMKGQKDAGGKEFDDLIDGVDHLIKIGLVDEKKVGITGGSYGGYATAWGSTYYSPRFAAGVMFVGISDWISCAGTTDIPQEMFLVHHRKWLWDDWDYFAKASPLKYLHKAKTPLLIMHGKNDPRVNPGQSLELYRHLKVRNQAPVRLVLYPGEGHGNRRAASRLDYNIRLLQWMEHYLKGPGGAMPALEIDYGLTPPAKTSASWDTRAPQTPTATPWLGRGCPCCIGW